MDSKVTELIIFAALLFGGWILETIWFDKRTKRKLSLRNYLLFILGPVVSTIYAVWKVGDPAIYMFLASILLGAVCEYVVDRSYAVFFGARLWRYYRYTINGNTSYLILPIWGAAGVAGLLLARIFLST